MNNPSINLQKVADYFLYKANNSRKPISNKKLQKLVYYAQAWNLVLNDKALFRDPIEAWIHGPAIRSLYTKYKKYGFMNIPLAPTSPQLSLNVKKVLNEVWRVYSKFDADYLEALAHSEKPWLEARGNMEANDTSNAIIDLQTMKSFYASLLR